MRTLCAIFVTGFAAACLAGCGSLQTRNELTAARKGAEKAYRNISQKVDSKHFCILGVRAGANGTVLQVGTRARQQGILPGDKIVAIEGGAVKDWAEAKERLHAHRPNETVTVTLLRNGLRVERKCDCLDVAETAAATASALRYAADGDWSTCAERMKEMQVQFSPSPVAQNILVDCYKYYLISEGKEPDEAFASELVTLSGLNIEEVSSSRERLEKLKNSVLAQVDWLKKNGFPDWAAALEKKYHAALEAVMAEEKGGWGTGGS